MRLEDTIEMMVSDNYIDELKAEYYQLDIRLNKLTEMISMIMEEGYSELCPLSILQDQKKIMQEYKQTIGIRAIIEGIEL